MNSLKKLRNPPQSLQNPEQFVESINKSKYVLSKSNLLWNPQLYKESANCKWNPQRVGGVRFCRRIPQTVSVFRINLRNPFTTAEIAYICESGTTTNTRC